MDRFWPIIIGTLIVITVIVMAFTFLQVQSQQSSLVSDLEYRTGVLAESLRESVEPVYNSKSNDSLQKILDKFANKQRLLGLAVFNNKGELIAFSTGLPKEIIDKASPSQSMDSDSAVSVFVRGGFGKAYEYIIPLHQENAVVGALMVAQKSDYIDDAIGQIWKTNLLRLLMQVLVFAMAMGLIVRWLIFAPVIAMIKSIRLIRSGKSGQEGGILKNYSFLRPLAKEISKISDSLTIARSAASEEARLRMEKIDTPWTAERLKEFIKAYLKDRKIYIVSNREPYVHIKVKNEIQEPLSIGGMVTAIEPVMEACGGMWIAQAMGNADRETSDHNGKLQVPTEDPKYTLKRLWLSEKEKRGFYDGFSNEALWPLCHNAHTRPTFRKEDWQEYKKVNGKFAHSLLAEIKNVQRPIILIQDFHLALLPQMIKKSRPDADVGIFWHVPWPTAEIFNICPWHKEILEGMLGADIIGFHTQQYCNNFMSTVSKGIESIVDLEQFSIAFKGHYTRVRAFPISIAFTNGHNVKEDSSYAEEFLNELGIKTKYLGLGVDRMDYTKGILERFKGVEFFLESNSIYKKQFTFLQIAPPSRETVKKYKEFSEEVEKEAERINEKFKDGGWQPIVLVKKHLNHKELYPIYRKANFCLVTSLHDGMNLVAKEFVASRNDESGVLILSQFTGASKDLKGALIINPYSAEETATAIYESLNMPPMQQHQRMKKMRNAVKNYNVYRWSAEFIKAISEIEHS